MRRYGYRRLLWFLRDSAGGGSRRVTHMSHCRIEWPLGKAPLARQGVYTLSVQYPYYHGPVSRQALEVGSHASVTEFARVVLRSALPNMDNR